MKKNIWIWNHYATSMHFNEGGRHYCFAKYLILKGYKVKIQVPRCFMWVTSPE
jgi:hypothetical protein